MLATADGQGRSWLLFARLGRGSDCATMGVPRSGFEISCVGGAAEEDAEDSGAADRKDGTKCQTGRGANGRAARRVSDQSAARMAGTEHGE